MCGLLCGLVCGQPRHPTVCSSALYAMRASAAARRLSRDVHMYLPVRSRDILSTPVELPNDLPRSPAAGSHSTPTSGASPSPSPDSSAPSTPQSHAISHEISLYVYTYIRQGVYTATRSPARPFAGTRTTFAAGARISSARTSPVRRRLLRPSTAVHGLPPLDFPAIDCRLEVRAGHRVTSRDIP